MQNRVEGILEIYEDTVEVLLVLEIFLTQDSYVENLLCGAFSCSERSPLKKKKKEAQAGNVSSSLNPESFDLRKKTLPPLMYGSSIMYSA